jgi:hypothetical protein
MKIPVFVIIAVGALIVGACLIASIIVASCYPALAAIIPNYLQAAFTGFALVGLLATLWHERENTEDSRQQHTELLAAMLKQGQESERLVEATTKQAKVRALIARIDGYTVQIKAERAKHAGLFIADADPHVKKLTMEQTELLRRLDALMN